MNLSGKRGLSGRPRAEILLRREFASDALAKQSDKTSFGLSRRTISTSKAPRSPSTPKSACAAMHPLPRTATQAVKNFRMREIEGLMSHLRIFGPLPEASDTAAAPPAEHGKEAISLPNPFIPKKNPRTGKWREPKYSLRRQADLVKKALAIDSLNLIPSGPKKLAFELRMKRVQQSLPAGAVLPVVEAAPETKKPVSKRRLSYNEKVEALKKEMETRETQLGPLEKKLEELIPQYDLDQVAAFDAKIKGKKVISSLRKTRTLRAQEKKELEDKISDTKIFLETTKQKLIDMEIRRKVLQVELVKMREQSDMWKTPVVWAGKVVEKKVAGSDLGTRLYAGKKRMFKGHLWERQRAKRVRRHTILMRDMAVRVARYKEYYKKRKPNPLKPSRYSKPPKLPF